MPPQLHIVISDPEPSPSHVDFCVGERILNRGPGGRITLMYNDDSPGSIQMAHVISNLNFGLRHVSRDPITQDSLKSCYERLCRAWPTLHYDDGYEHVLFVLSYDRALELLRFLRHAQVVHAIDLRPGTLLRVEAHKVELVYQPKRQKALAA